MIDQIVIATNNPHKVAEILFIFEEIKLQSIFLTPQQLKSPPKVVEDEATFTANALKKARELCAHSGLTTVADDSGLVVDALDGEPGILSARWAGAHGDDEANLQLVLKQMQEVPDELRQARFVCAAAVALTDGREFAVVGELLGTLTRAPRGNNGFGYDSIFIPKGYQITTGEMDPLEKNSISHRGIAFRKLAKLLEIII